jgi:hypothetical protein
MEEIMKEYRPQLRISSNDPLCSATTLGDSVIGILFEKKGSEVKQAIDARLTLIDKKIVSYEATAKKVEIFIEQKRDILRDIDHYYVERSDSKTALIKPYQRQVDVILLRCNDAVDTFDKVTHKGVAEKAVHFEKGSNS